MCPTPEKSEKSNSSKSMDTGNSETDTESAFNAEDNVNYAPHGSIIVFFDQEPKTVGCSNCKHVTYHLDADLQLEPARPPTPEIAMGIAQGRARLSCCMNCGYWKINR